MSSIVQRRKEFDFFKMWDSFCAWITSTDNRIYIGWFGVLMIPTLLVATICFILAFIAAPSVDMDGIREPVMGSLLDGNNLITAAVVPTSAAIGLHLYPIWEAASIDEWLYNGGPYQLIVLHFLIGIWCYLGRLWELSYRLGLRPWIAVAFSAPAAAATAVLLIYPIGQGSFSDGLPLGIAGTFHFMMAFQADHNVLMHPFHMLGVAGVFGGALLSVLHGSLVTSTFIRKPGDDELINAKYKFGQPDVTYNFLAGHYGFLGRLLIPTFASQNHRTFHLLLVALPTIGIWFAALGVGVMAFNLNGFNFHHSILDSQGAVISTMADLLNRASLGIQAMHAPNTHNFPLVLSSGGSISIS
ncbi:Photosystem Q(B) protein 1 [Aetokthonos hydrillicola Thurmond2011]|jgi:photosystem II P680 reaction center D1 protein|uniref:Photosystem II protein D1 n=1 Tax=Aetokthonos hydrillicola Thurmond2011 TaxID=2712845 RepID=A0AAP5M939_9CYAN|nr:Photosystem Q(B) protein 1 [Aetokthonos hydrillicola]MBO3460086.1 Photosystem Q(B) protein 1 [Aetokthonos hydrillicola CCALA 1050]MBW4589515.1 Photosystem Q(B) protein 1 [Aetokthonos hydrillicola CCALA 1050]MDR9899811.1 Photosystem Q(B) protein 1 [Aetokthonos hydrillicola Thurmond2011]